MANPVNAVTNAETGSRFYVHPITGERFISVTTVLGNINKYGLPDWAAKLAAQAAMDRAAWLHDVAEYGAISCNLAGDDRCGGCKTCALQWLADRHNVARDEAGDRGSRLHNAADTHTLFGPGGHVDEDIRPLLDHYLRWIDAWKPEFVASEATVISRKHKYAGTLDGMLRLNDADLLPPQFRDLVGQLLVMDIKSGKHVGLLQGWQIAPYAHADVVLLPDGSEEPMPPIAAGLIIHVRPDKLQVRRVDITPETSLNYFLHLLHVVEGLSAPLGSVLSRPFTLKEI